MRVVFLAFIAASPAAAQTGPATFSLPVGCTAYLTTQNANCEVEHHFICESDPAGYQQRASLDERGMTFLAVIDAEAQWIKSYSPASGINERLLPDAADPASVSELITTGVDHYDFYSDRDPIGPVHYVGADRLTGREVTIDGVTLLETSYEITASAPDGTIEWSARGSEYVSPDWQRFFGGTGVRSFSHGEESYDERPIEFIFPGEPGFLSTRPKHGCGVAISSAPLSEETTYDHL
ncbi:hypothetical protein DS901_10190 [Loktanella sp. D2R18]|uniref:hypothetical protein n=1 Tax=Rhodobacterales TaxID=204455 RepID=UPI000DE94710|nr:MULTISPECIES: hypothetical protein [Rhodobacterales]MDO6591364.1 hypothetical protein [Yoonia sp. 1_MG-2023]RBW43563.1 hypothetical protein DS901_10190 [Loktanella sp. D2R18]